MVGHYKIISAKHNFTYSLSSVAKDRGWFTEYTPFETELGDVYGMMKQPIRVLGIGTVELFTEPPPGSVRQGQDLPPPLRLTTVLHAPSATCNIIGVPIMDDYELVPNFREKEKGFIADQGGRKIAYFDPSRPLMQVKLRDPPPPGHNVLKHGGGGYFINAKWSDSERERWHAHQTNTTEKKSSLSVEEKTWLKKYYGSEFSFLRQYGLNIYQEEDREEGRILLRSFMQAGTEKEASTTASKRRKLR